MRFARDDLGRAHLLALSGGKDSTALALLLAEREPHVPLTYFCTPTGDELPEMAAHWARLDAMLPSPILRFTLPTKAGGAETLTTLVERMGCLPNHRARFCTRLLKIVPAQRLMALAGPAVLYVGLRADEEERRGIFGSGLNVRFPLREWGLGEADVWAALAERGVSIPRRTDCARCYHQRLIEWRVLLEEHPEVYEAAAAQEDARGRTWRSPGRDTWPVGLRELAEAFRSGRPVRGEEAYRARVERGESPCRVCSL